MKKTLYIKQDSTTCYPESVVVALSELFEFQDVRLTLDEDAADIMVECIKEERDYRLTIWIDQEII